MQINSNPEVNKFISSLEKPTISKVVKIMDLLEKFGFNLSMPYSRNMSGGLFELRTKGRQEVRIFYCFNEGQVWLLSGFVKKTQKTPNDELLRARNRREFLTS